jgi:hypothetical protein
MVVVEVVVVVVVVEGFCAGAYRVAQYSRTC